MNYFVEIVKFGSPEEVVERMGPMGERNAEQVGRGVSINLNHSEYFVRTVKAV